MSLNMHFRPCHALALIVLTSAPASAQDSVSATTSTQQWYFAGVHFPAAIDTFAVWKAQRWLSEPSLGMSLTYVIPADDLTELTLYRYPLGAAGREVSPSVARDSEFARNMHELEEYARTNRGLDSLIAEGQDSVVVATAVGPLVGRRATYTMWKDGYTLRSVLYLFVAGGGYSKLRISFAPSAATSLAPHIAATVAALLNATAKPGSP